MKNLLRNYRNIIIFVVVIIVFVASFFIFNNMSNDNNDISLVTLDEPIVVINNKLPMTDVVGKAIGVYSNKVGTTGYLEFEVKSGVNDNVRYEVYLTKNSVEAEVPMKFVKVYLTDSKDKVLKNYDKSSVLTYYDLKSMPDNKDSKFLFSGTLKANASQKFKLRMWVADTYELTTDARSFSVKLNVRVK